MYCVGLTGNIASGKSTVASFLKSKGITVISADHIARDLTKKNGLAYKKIINRFGESILATSKEIDRAKLRQIIFSNPEQRLWLEQLLHPLIREHIVELLPHSRSPYSVVEIPLLKDRRVYPYLDRVLAVLSDQQEQIRRVIKRDNCSKEEAKAILLAQPDDAERIAIADDIILNNDSLEVLKEQITNLHQRYLQFAADKTL
ncbi:dephospho-CoA kinase [Legionella hackeliae]|uniref:Dephospho-CoA kinase n=1 Tax=Legionella hackeliae TaxID=449 RepID=A0A0A8UUF9_LEGHA|nr:dephospho-CoA kinase [Legionella hackeliae]KTD11455.1 dephospho-CoA kinase [Legionella hackeliae]CEK10712.1 Dephospho-CoA kinase [Legionella hackeliae]STX47461.1 dephospho-CoA kinase [Legionella hackeliae]